MSPRASRGGVEPYLARASRRERAPTLRAVATNFMRASTLVLGLFVAMRATSAASAGALANPPGSAPPNPENTERAAVARWIAAEGLNEYGDAAGTMYAGGSPLFDETTGRTTDLLEYVARRHPDRPWSRRVAVDALEDADEDPARDPLIDDDDDENDENAPPPRFPPRWGPPPAIQTMDYRPLPGGYGFGSSTLASWIEAKMAEDASANADGEGASEAAPPPRPDGGGGAASSSRFPAHWGPEPAAQTRDYRELPGGYGFGSGTLARWIAEKMAEDEAAEGGAEGGAAPAPSREAEDLRRFSF